MIKMMRYGIGILALIVSQWAQGDVSKIPVKDFFKNPSYTSLQLSPNGKYIAMLSPINNRRNIVVMETDGFKNLRPLTGLKNQDIRGFSWANNETIVFTLDANGNEAFSIYKVNALKKNPKIRTLVGANAANRAIVSATIAHFLPNDPDHIIVQFNERNVMAPDLYKVPLDSEWKDTGRTSLGKSSGKKGRNSKMELIAENPGNVQGWLIDHDGEVRGALSMDGLEGKFHYKSKGEKEFRVLREFNALEEVISPMGFDFDNKTLFVGSNIGRDKTAIYRFDPEKNKLGELVFAHDVVDVTGLMLSRHQQKLIGVQYINDYPETHYFDEAEEKIKKQLEAAFPGKRVGFSSQTEDESLRIISVSNDRDPGTYYLFDTKKMGVTPLVARMDWLNPELMSPMKPIEYKARDGLTIRGYVTIPKHTNGKKLPLIVNPHGGPFGVRDAWGFNPEHQFFASRGYATVQINFRGSGGYGREFEQAGYGKWGAEMQHDITDGVKYLIEQGIADPERVCIYGASYGGYATMAGLTFTPELYKCGINYVGVTDVGLLFETMPKHWEAGREMQKIRIGDPEDKEFMKRISPLAHVNNIDDPLMIVHGARDPRVVKEHATLLRDALEERGIELTDDEWIMKKDEGHGFGKEENRIELYTKMERFLAKYL